MEEEVPLFLSISVCVPFIDFVNTLFISFDWNTRLSSCVFLDLCILFWECGRLLGIFITKLSKLSINILEFQIGLSFWAN